MADFTMGVTHDVSKSDTANDKFDWLMVTTTAGSVVVLHEGGNVTTLAAPPVGVWLPMTNGLAIKTASTAVGFMVA